MHSSVSALQISVWEPSPCFGRGRRLVRLAPRRETAVAVGFLPEEESVLEEGLAVGAVEGSAEGAAEGGRGGDLAAVAAVGFTGGIGRHRVDGKIRGGGHIPPIEGGVRVLAVDGDEGTVRQAAVGGAGQRDALGQRAWPPVLPGLREVGGAALGKDVGGGNGAVAGDGAAAVAEVVLLPPMAMSLPGR